MMENANSLSLFTKNQWKIRKLQNLNNKYESDALLLNETGTNWSLAPDGKKLADIFGPGKVKRISAGFNKHECITRSQYSGTTAIALSRLAGYVVKSGSDSTGLG